METLEDVDLIVIMESCEKVGVLSFDECRPVPGAGAVLVPRTAPKIHPVAARTF